MRYFKPSIIKETTKEKNTENIDVLFIEKMSLIVYRNFGLRPGESPFKLHVCQCKSGY